MLSFDGGLERLEGRGRECFGWSVEVLGVYELRDVLFALALLLES